MDIKILDTSHGPIYEQIRTRIAEQIESGTLKSGDELPSPGALSQKYSVDRGEVSRAYFELEQQNLVTSKRSKNFLGESVVTYLVA